MTWSLDRTTNTGKVRVLVTGESVEATAVFQDEDIDVFLDLSADAPYLAAALALERIAADQALLFRKIKVGSIELDGPAVAAAFLALAARYRGIYASGPGDAASDFMIAEMIVDPASYAEAILNDAIRGGELGGV